MDIEQFRHILQCPTNFLKVTKYTNQQVLKFNVDLMSHLVWSSNGIISYTRQPSVIKNTYDGFSDVPATYPKSPTLTYFIYRPVDSECYNTMNKFEFLKNGFVTIEDFFTEAEVNEMKDAGERLTTDIPLETRVIFNTSNSSHVKSRYFLESNDKIRYFFEDGALDKDGNLLVEPKFSLNKVGHALHWLHPVFKMYTFCDKIKDVCLELGLEEPCVAQSMYIYKNPKIGSEVSTHQDASYLHTVPEHNLIGFWIALEDATKENGCLWFAPGSHKSGVHRRFIRNPNRNSEELLIYTSPEQTYDSSHFIPLPVRKGTLVLISGLVVHRSEPNKSNRSRHVYTFHVVDMRGAKYSKLNWLQPSPELPFPNIYKN